jgi:hypothetical protein
MPPGAVLVLPSAEALELTLGAGVGVVVAEAMPATPIPAPRASAAADKPRVIFFVRDILCLLDLPSVTAADGSSLPGHSKHRQASSGTAVRNLSSSCESCAEKLAQRAKLHVV